MTYRYPEPDEVDAWKQAREIAIRYTQEREVRRDLVVTALGTERAVRLRVGDRSYNSIKPNPKDHTEEPRITTRNVETMRDLAHAILEACDFVESVNPTWSELSGLTMEGAYGADADTDADDDSADE